MPTLIDTPPMTALLTAEEFCRIPNPVDGSVLELHDGKMIVMPPPKKPESASSGWSTETLGRSRSTPATSTASNTTKPPP